MSPIAIIMLVISIVILWGGLVASIVNLRVRPQVEGLGEPDEMTSADLEREKNAPLHRDT